MQGSLLVVGLGMNFEAHLTLETLSSLQQANKIFFLANDEQTSKRFQNLFPNAHDLFHLYQKDINRSETYTAIVELLMENVREGKRVCAAFYGHPGVFVSPANSAIQQARAEGYRSAMLPAISAQASFFADLGIDPAVQGLQTYEATDFLIRQRQPDLSSGLMLWQVGVVGNLKPPGADISKGLELFRARLIKLYSMEHMIFLYIAATSSDTLSQIYYIPLSELTQEKLDPATTMYIPPIRKAQPDLDVARQLGLLQPSNK